jgi:hypothetical protein
VCVCVCMSVSVCLCFSISSYAIMAFTRIILLYLLRIIESWDLFISGSLNYTGYPVN